MKIDGNQLGGVPPESISKTGAAGDAEATRRAARLGYRNSSDGPSAAGLDSGSTDEVAISGLGRELSRVDSEREARIEKLAALHDQGGIPVDSAQVAKKVIDDAFYKD
jgi:anti-sigma28 factor (negative regulator of flagellin synthesis)